MRILVVHNYYQQTGGEDQIFATECALLEARGHEVRRYTVHNDQIKGMNPLLLAKATVWNSDIYQQLRTLVHQERPQIVHFHNTFPLISPAAYYAVKAEGVPVVQTLHNYRLLCLNAYFFRDGHTCEDCLGKLVPWPGVVHNCYRSRAASSTLAAMLPIHSLLGTWMKAVDVFIAYSKFAHNKFIQGGLPANKIAFKTNFLHPAPCPGQGKGGYGLFVGRLSPEKGLSTLLAAWETLGSKVPLKIVGDGPLSQQVAEAVERVPGVEWLGLQSLTKVYELMGEAAFLVFPSEWYETFGRVAIEAFAKGTPVIAANIGAIAELIDNGRTGILYCPGQPEDLRAKVEWALTHPSELAQMRKEARAEFEAKYTVEQNYQILMSVYERAMSH